MFIAAEINSIAMTNKRTTKVVESLEVDVPVDQCRRALQAYIDTLPSGDSKTAKTIRLSASVGTGKDSVTLSHDADAHFVPVRESDGFIHSMAIDWAPVEGKAFPQFLGFLLTEAAPGNFRRSTITIEGCYDPPLGLIGEVFDGVIGKKIAAATVRDLLDNIRIALEE